MMNAVKLASFVDTELQTTLQDSLVTKDSLGKYYLFGRYSVVLSNGYYTVQTGNKTLLFSALKTATAWCVLDNAGKYFEANRIETLDLKLCSMTLDIAIHKNKIKTAKTDAEKLIFIIKLQEDNYKRRSILNELDIYINSAKRIQDKIFHKKDSKFNYV